MNFGPTNICPPLYYIIVFPTQSYISSADYSYNSLRFDDSNAETISPQTPNQDKIILTRKDLLEEGYQQTKKAWTEEQDQLLLKLCSNHHSRFEEIAPFLPGRNPKMCYSRHRRLINKSKDCWTKTQNAKLLTLVEENGQNWRTFQQHFPNRNYKQLKDHYENYLRPNLKKGEWTIEDDLLLINLINQHGKNWALIEEKMCQRSRNQIKNRYFGRIKRINARKMASVATEDHSFGNKLSLLPI